MKKKLLFMLLIILIIMAVCSGCAKEEEYNIPVEIYTFTDVDSLDDAQKELFIRQLEYNLSASKKDKSISEGEYNKDTGLILFSFTDEQKESYIETLENHVKSGDAGIFSNGAYEVKGYSDDYRKLTINISNKETLDRCMSYLRSEVGGLIQLQILSGTDYSETKVTVEMNYNDGTQDVRDYTWNTVY